MRLARTEIDTISLKALLELVVVERDDAKVASVATTVDITGDFGCPIEVPDDALVGVAPGRGEELEEVAQLNHVLLHSLQILLLPLLVLLVFRRRLFVLGFWLGHQFRKLLGEELGVTELSGNECTGLVDDLLEPTAAAVAHELLRRTPTVVVVLGGVGGGGMLVSKTHDSIALVATPVLSLVEVQTERALRIAVRQRLRGEGNTQDNCQSSANVVGRVRVPDDAHHGWGSTEGLDSAFDPVDSYVFDAMLGEDGEDVGVGVAAGGLLSGVGMDGDPEHDVVVDNSHVVIIVRGETDRQHCRDANATARILEKLDDLRSNRLLPKLVLEDWVVR